MEYEDRIIIYLDILGFSNFVNYTGSSQVNRDKKIDKVNNYLEMLQKFFKPSERLSESRVISTFSDSIVISISTKDIDNLDMELLEIYFLLTLSIKKGFLLRGAITYGKLIHTQNIVFGPGLITAYNLERDIVKFPRIIIDENIVKDLNDLPTYIPRDHPNLLNRDDDGLYYIDYFKGTRNYSTNFREYTIFLSNYIDVLLNILDNPSLKEKINWLKRKLAKHIAQMENIFDFQLDANMGETELRAFQGYLSQFDKIEYELQVL